MAPILTALVWAFLFCGGGTWYHEPGRLTRDETEYQSNGKWCAVDSGRYNDLKGRYVLCYGQWGRAILPVRDSGRLRPAGVAIDLPRDTFKRIFGTPDTQSVNVYLVGREIPWKQGPRRIP